MKTLVIKSPQVAVGSFRKLNNINIKFKTFGNKANKTNPLQIMLNSNVGGVCKIVARGCYLKHSTSADYEKDELTLNVALGTIVYFYTYSPEGYININCPALDVFPIISAVNVSAIDGIEFALDVDESLYLREKLHLGFSQTATFQTPKQSIRLSDMATIFGFYSVRLRSAPKGNISVELDNPITSAVNNRISVLHIENVNGLFGFDFSVFSTHFSTPLITLLNNNGIKLSGAIDTALRSDVVDKIFIISTASSAQESDCYFDISKFPREFKATFNLDIKKSVGGYVSKPYIGNGNVTLNISEIEPTVYDQILEDFARGTYVGASLTVYTRTSSSDTAIATLQARGVTVKVTKP